MAGRALGVSPASDGGVVPKFGRCSWLCPKPPFAYGALVLFMPCAVLVSILLQSRGDVQLDLLLVTRVPSLEGSQGVGVSGVLARGRGADSSGLPAKVRALISRSKQCPFPLTVLPSHYTQAFLLAVASRSGFQCDTIQS